MRFMIWNASFIRMRVDRVIASLERSGMDVLAMQEIKCRSDQLSTKAFEEAGYHVATHGLNQWNGVVVASCLPILDVQDHFPTQPAFGEPLVVEARAFDVTINTTNTLPSEDRQASSMTIWSLYVSNGCELTYAHYTHKLERLANLAEQGHGWLTDPNAPIALVGDWNVASLDEDVWGMSAFEGVTHMSTPKHEAFTVFAADGWTEVTRERVTNYIYWGYQKLRFPKNEGMRTNFAYCSPAPAACVSGAQIDRDECKGKGASNHVPAVVDVD